MGAWALPGGWFDSARARLAPDRCRAGWRRWSAGCGSRPGRVPGWGGRPRRFPRGARSPSRRWPGRARCRGRPGIQDRQDAFDGALFHLAHEAQLIGVHAAAFAQRSRQQAAVLVDDGDVFGGQFRHAGSDQPGDGGHLGVAQAATGVQVQQHRGRGAWRSRTNSDWRGMARCTRACCTVHGFDRTGQLAFQAALVVDLFGELAGAEAGVVHQLEADRAAARQSLRGQLQPGVIDAVGRNQQGGAVLVVAIGHVHLPQRRHDGAAVAVLQVREQDLVGSLLHMTAATISATTAAAAPAGRAWAARGLFPARELRQQRRAQSGLLIHLRPRCCAELGKGLHVRVGQITHATCFWSG